jgi:predicted nucleic acid-binding protein
LMLFCTKKCYVMSKPNAFFVDTNFLINITQDNPLVYPFLDVDIFISYITEIELLGVFSITKSIRINKQNWLNSSTIVVVKFVY